LCLQTNRLDLLEERQGMSARPERVTFSGLSVQVGSVSKLLPRPDVVRAQSLRQATIGDLHRVQSHFGKQTLKVREIRQAVKELGLPISADNLVALGKQLGHVSNKPGPKGPRKLTLRKQYE
jgi:hypothetical protein